MENLSVILHTGRHCIETGAKNEFRRISGELIESEDEACVDLLAARLELLREFIETADFNALRSSDERLAGLVPGICTLSRKDDGLPGITRIENGPE